MGDAIMRLPSLWEPRSSRAGLQSIMPPLMAALGSAPTDPPQTEEAAHAQDFLGIFWRALVQSLICEVLLLINLKPEAEVG